MYYFVVLSLSKHFALSQHDFKMNQANILGKTFISHSLQKNNIGIPMPICFFFKEIQMYALLRLY